MGVIFTRQKGKVECAWLLLLSSASGLLAPLTHYPLPSYHSKSPALVASGVFALEDFSLWLARGRALFTGPPVVEPTSLRSLYLSPFRLRLFLARNRDKQLSVACFQSLSPTMRLQPTASTPRPPTSQPPLASSPSDGSPDFWLLHAARAVSPRPSNGCCRGAPNPGPRLLHGRVQGLISFPSAPAPGCQA